MSAVSFRFLVDNVTLSPPVLLLSLPLFRDKLEPKGCDCVLTKKQYKALVKYRNGPIDVPDTGLTDEEVYLSKVGYIEPATYGVETSEHVSYFGPTAYQITQEGEAAIEGYRDRRRSPWKDLAFFVLGSVITIIAQHVVDLIVA